MQLVYQKKSWFALTGARWNHWVMMAFQCWMFNAECPQVRNYIIQKIPNGIAWIDFDSHCKFIVWHSYALCVCSLTFCGAAVLKVFKQNWNFHFFVSCYCLKQASKSHSPQIYKEKISCLTEFMDQNSISEDVNYAGSCKWHCGCVEALGGFARH